MRMGYGTDRRTGAAVYPGIPCTGAGMASCDLHPQTPVYKWNLKAVERGVGERQQQQLGTIDDHSWFCKDLLAD